ncbi:hypothetical protein ACFYRD_32080 [Streptomyces hirsutus]|uniref:hypothetical protein n=1 Tax=Streptomyces hirsutus TaxID=35620 RepID=UPI00368F674B
MFLDKIRISVSAASPTTATGAPRPGRAIEAARAGVFRFIEVEYHEVEYHRTHLREHPVHGYVTPLETRALTTQDLAPAA